MKDQGHPDLLALAEQAWRGELDLQFEHHPVHRYYPGSCRIAEDLLGFKGIAGFYVIDSGDGLVMLDAGHLLDVKHEARAAIYRANADSQPSSMARNILNHAALASDRGRRDLASDE